MTPLAQQIVRRGLRGDDFRWAEAERSDCRCFEVTQVLPLMREIGWNEQWQPMKDTLFLPAPVTWIEWAEERGEGKLLWNVDGQEEAIGGRLGYLILEARAGTEVDLGGYRHRLARDGYVIRFCVQPDGGVPTLVQGSEQNVLEPDASGKLLMLGTNAHNQEIFHATGAALKMAMAALALINTPRIVGRRTHSPHAGLQREIARKRKMVGKFPLQAWTEITLDLTPPREAIDDGHEAHLTGGRALHFCRAHLRVRLGKLEYVRWHWRGDPAVGIKQSRYVVKPPRPGAGQAA